MNSLLSNIFLLPMGIGSSILLGLSAYKDNNFSLLTDNKSYNKPISALLLLSFTYFVTDFLFMIIKYKPRHKIFFIHHALGILTIPMIYFNNYHLVKYVLAYLTFELTTPLLNISIANRQNNIIGHYRKITDSIFLITYTLVRIIFGSYLMYKTVPITYEMKYPYKCLMFSPIAIQALNYWWYYKILSVVFKRKQIKA